MLVLLVPELPVLELQAVTLCWPVLQVPQVERWTQQLPRLALALLPLSLLQLLPSWRVASSSCRGLLCAWPGQH